MTKATQLSNSPHIIYDGFSSRQFGVTNVQPANGLAQEIFIANTSLVTDQSRYNDRVYLLGVNREPLQFSMRLLFDPHTFDERKLQDIKRWFYQDTYKPFRYDSAQESDLDIWVYAICTGESSVRHNAIDDAYVDFHFETNAPYRFTQVMEDEYDFSITNTEKMETQLKEGFFAVTEGIEDMSSRLKQSIVPLEKVTNRTADEYRKLLYPYIVKARELQDELNEPFNNLNKVKGAINTYRNQWLTQRSDLNGVLSDMQILWNRIENLENNYLYSTPNLYSQNLANMENRLYPDGNETVTNWYRTSGFIGIDTEKYVWYTDEDGGTLENPVVVFYDNNRNYIDGRQLTNGKQKIIDNFPEGAESFRVSGKANDYSDVHWKIERNKRTHFTASPFDLFPEILESRIMQNVRDMDDIMEELDSLQVNVTNYINNISKSIDNTLDLYPDVVVLHNFGDLPVKPVMEIEVVDPVDIRIENIETGESTTITDNIKGEKITLKNESEQIVTSRPAPYYKYDAHDDNFITLRKFENTLQFFGSYKVKITYQFKML